MNNNDERDYAEEAANAALLREDDATYTAAVCFDSGYVEGDFCDLTIAEDVIRSYDVDEDGTETPRREMGDTIVLETVELPIRTDDEDGKLEPAADEALASNGWRRTEEWFSAGYVMYAPVERA